MQLSFCLKLNPVFSARNTQGMVITSHEMSGEHNTSSTFTGLLSLDDKSVNTSPQNGKYFNRYCEMSLYLSDTSKINNQ